MNRQRASNLLAAPIMCMLYWMTGMTHRKDGKAEMTGMTRKFLLFTSKGSGSGFWPVTVPVPVPAPVLVQVPAPYLDHKQHFFQKCVWKTRAFLHSKLFYKEKLIRAGIFKKSMGARHGGGIGFSYRPARLHRLAEFIPWNQCRGPINI